MNGRIPPITALFSPSSRQLPTSCCSCSLDRLPHTGAGQQAGAQHPCPMSCMAHGARRGRASETESRARVSAQGEHWAQAPGQPVMEMPWAAPAQKPWIPAAEAEVAALRLRVRDEHPPREGPERGRRVGPRPRWEARQQGESPREGWVSTGAVGGEGATGCRGWQGPGVSGLQEGAGCGEQGWAAAGRGGCCGVRGGQLGDAGQSRGGRGACR